MKLRDTVPFIGMPLMLLTVQIGALLLSPSMKEAGYAAFEDPSSVTNPLIFIAILLIFTAFLLILIKKGGKKIIAAIIGISIFLTFVYIFGAVAGHITDNTTVWTAITLIASTGATGLLYYYPEWYVIDILGILISAGAASIFGISLEIMPVIILLILLAVYDAISVYKTKHMLTLAEGIIEMKTPILVVIPKSWNYSYIKEGVSIKNDKKDRGAFIMGLGDLIMPTILVVSSNMFLKAPEFVCNITIPTAGAIIGSFTGLFVLLYYVNKGNPQAGLPTLNGGAIIGFLIACAVTGSLGWIPGI